MSGCLDCRSQSSPLLARAVFIVSGAGHVNTEAWQPSGSTGARAESTTRTLLLLAKALTCAVGASRCDLSMTGACLLASVCTTRQTADSLQKDLGDWWAQAVEKGEGDPCSRVGCARMSRNMAV